MRGVGGGAKVQKRSGILKQEQKRHQKSWGLKKKRDVSDKWIVKSSCQTSRCTIEKCPVAHLKPARFSVLTATTNLCIIKCLSISIFALSALDYYKSTYI